MLWYFWRFRRDHSLFLVLHFMFLSSKLASFFACIVFHLPINHWRLVGILMCLSIFTYITPCLLVLHSFDQTAWFFWMSNQADWDETLPHKFLIGLSSAHLSGRAQIVQDDTIKNSSGVNGSYPGGLTFYLDGAHSPESMEACARWFSAVVGENKNLSHLSSCSKNRTPKKIWVNGCIQDGDKQEPYKMSKQVKSQKDDFCYMLQHSVPYFSICSLIWLMVYLPDCRFFYLIAWM